MPTLFERYGGFATISKVVLSFYDGVLDSDVLAPYFEDVDMRRLVDHQTKFISYVMGGPASFTDETLRQVHAHLDIDDAAFDEMISLFSDTLEDYDFEEEDIHAVISALENRRPIIVARPDR